MPPELEQRVIGDYLQRRAQVVKEIPEAAREEDREVVARLSHGLIMVAGWFREQELVGVLRGLEGFARSEAPWEDAASLLAKLARLQDPPARLLDVADANAR